MKIYRNINRLIFWTRLSTIFVGVGGTFFLLLFIYSLSVFYFFRFHVSNLVKFRTSSLLVLLYFQRKAKETLKLEGYWMKALSEQKRKK